MINLPKENFKTIRETIKFLKRNKIKTMTPNFPIPYFGTELFKKLKKKNLNKNFSWENIENYAGKVETKINRKLASFYYKILNYINKSK